MNELMQQLHDIEGLDLISRWPLGVGWWILIAIVIVAFVGVVYYVYKRLVFRRSWQHEAQKELDKLEGRLSDATSRETAIALSLYIRRIAVYRYPREECAGLIGGNWLQWLSENDPKKFDWKQKGQPLIQAPYAPADLTISSVEVRDLIQAVRRWVR